MLVLFELTNILPCIYLTTLTIGSRMHLDYFGTEIKKKNMTCHFFNCSIIDLIMFQKRGEIDVHLGCDLQGLHDALHSWRRTFVKALLLMRYQLYTRTASTMLHKYSIHSEKYSYFQLQRQAYDCVERYRGSYADSPRNSLKLH